MINQEPYDIIEINGVKYQRIVKKPKPQTLYDVIYDWKYNTWDSTCEKLVEMIEEWLFNNFYSCSEHNEGWNDCLTTIKKNLK